MVRIYTFCPKLSSLVSPVKVIQPSIMSELHLRQRLFHLILRPSLFVTGFTKCVGMLHRVSSVCLFIRDICTYLYHFLGKYVYWMLLCETYSIETITNFIIIHVLMLLFECRRASLEDRSMSLVELPYIFCQNLSDFTSNTLEENA